MGLRQKKLKSRAAFDALETAKNWAAFHVARTIYVYIYTYMNKLGFISPSVERALCQCTASFVLRGRGFHAIKGCWPP